MVINAVQRGNVVFIYRDDNRRPMISLNSGDTLSGWSSQGVTINRRNAQCSFYNEDGHCVKTVAM